MSTYLKVTKIGEKQKHFASVHIPHGPILLKKTIQVSRDKNAKVDELNNWEYCDPDNLIDSLPQPYQMIDEIFNEEIMERLNDNIIQIESLRTNPSYEGNIKEIKPFSTFEIENLTYLHRDKNSMSRFIMAGDQLGNFQLLEIENRIQIFKNEITPGKPIIHISSACLHYFDNEILLVCCCSLKDDIARGYLIKQNENKLHPFFEVHLPVDKTKTASNIINIYPKQSSISDDGSMLTITTWGGSLFLYSLPVIPLISESIGTAKTLNLLSPTLTKMSMGKKEEKKNVNPYIEKLTINSFADHKTVILTQPLITIPCKTPAIQPKLEDIFKSLDLVEKLAPDEKEKKQQNLKNENTNSKKGSAAALNQQQGKNKKGEPEQEIDARPGLEPIPNIELTNPLQIPDDPLYEPFVFFVFEELVIHPDLMYKEAPKVDDNESESVSYYSKSKNANKSGKKSDNIVEETNSHKAIKFSKKSLTLSIPTAIAVCWKNTNFFEIYKFQDCVMDNLGFLYTSRFVNYSELVAKRGLNNYKKIAKTKEDVLASCCQYTSHSNIIVASYNVSEKLLAVGTENGQVMVWNLEMCQLQYFFNFEGDKAPVQGLQYSNSRYLVASFSDGTLCIYDLRENSTFMNKKNFFTINSKLKHMENTNKIVKINIFQSDVFCALDCHQNFRLYSITKGEKMYRFSFDNKYMPELIRPMFENYKEFFCIKCNFVEGGGNTLVIFKTG